MPQPLPSAVHANRPLTNISIAYMQDAAGFVADRVFPNVPVNKQSDKYFVFPRGEFFRAQMEKRGPGDPSAGSGYKVEQEGPYHCDVWALHKDIDDQTRANYDEPLDPDREATEFLSLQALLRREIQWASKYFTTGIWTGIKTGVSGSPGSNEFKQWSDLANSDPISDIRGFRRERHKATGFWMNKFVVGRKVYDTLLDHPDIIDRLKYGQTPGAPAIANRRRLAELFEVEEILVMDGIKNTANEGATDSYDYIGSETDALLVYAPARSGLMTPSGGYTFSWRGYLPGMQGPMGQVISRFRRPAEYKSDRVEIEMAFDAKLIAADLGCFIDAAVA
jgi:hypothetical protein